MRRAASLLLWCASCPAWSSNVPAKIAITAASPKAVLILHAPRRRVWYSLGISPYDPTTATLRGAVMSGEDIIMPAGVGPDEYLVNEVKPGKYVIRAVNQQGYWMACFHDATFQFEVKAGDVLYLGHLDVDRALEDIQKSVGRWETVSSRIKVYAYFDNIRPPAISIDDRALTAARTFVATQMPRTTVVPRAVDFAPARFGTVTALLGQRLCGGVGKQFSNPLMGP